MCKICRNITPLPAMFQELCEEVVKEDHLFYLWNLILQLILIMISKAIPLGNFLMYVIHVY